MELSALHDPELILATLAGVPELPEQSGMPALDAVMEHLRGRRLLIVLDTCEHLVDACAMLCDILLREAAGLSVLATSRQPLDVPGEHCVPIAPLAREDALDLFTQRGAAVTGGLAATGADREATLAVVHPHGCHGRAPPATSPPAAAMEGLPLVGGAAPRPVRSPAGTDAAGRGRRRPAPSPGRRRRSHGGGLLLDPAGGLGGGYGPGPAGRGDCPGAAPANNLPVQDVSELGILGLVG